MVDFKDVCKTITSPKKIHTKYFQQLSDPVVTNKH